jgi:putative endonuclease
MRASVVFLAPNNTNMPSPPPPSRPPALPWTVYLLRCRDGSLYCGITNDLPKRLKAHAAGQASRYTRSRLPVRLVYQEWQPTKSSALKREAAIKKIPRRQKLALVAKP